MKFYSWFRFIGITLKISRMNQIVPVRSRFRSLAWVRISISFQRTINSNDFLDPHQLLARKVSERRQYNDRKRKIECYCTVKCKTFIVITQEQDTPNSKRVSLQKWIPSLSRARLPTTLPENVYSLLYCLVHIMQKNQEQAQVAMPMALRRDRT